MAKDKILKIGQDVVFRNEMLEIRVGFFEDGLGMAIDFETLCGKKEVHVEIDFNLGDVESG